MNMVHKACFGDILKKKLREKFDFTGCPVQIFLRQK